MRDELLAFLEDGPHAAADLAAWLDQPKRLVTRALRALRQEGLAKPVGTAKHWALAGAVTRAGRPAVLDRVAIRRTVLAATRGCARVDTHTIRQRTGHSRKAVLAACVALVAEGHLTAIGRGRSAAWADPAGRVVPATTTEPTPPVHRDRRPAYDPRLRQLDEAERRRTAAAAERPGSFWLGLDRDQLRDAVAANQDRMHRSSMASRVDPNTRD